MSKTCAAKTSVDINAPADKVWEALVNPDLIKQYMHGAHVDSDWDVGSAITWSGEWNGQTYQDKGEILTYKPESVLSYTRWSPLLGDSDIPENYVHVTCTLVSVDEHTTLTLKQANSPSQELANDAMGSWKPVLQKVKKIVEGQSA